MTELQQESERALEGGNYEVIYRRLQEQSAELAAKADALNQRRQQAFGGGELALVATERVRTENNCVPRDLVSVAGHLLFGFHVFLGLKSETKPSDIFGLHRFERTADGYALDAVPLEGELGFLANPEFDKEFRTVFRYYKEARLLQLRRTENRLLAIVQVGAALTDVKVFRFVIDAAGRVSYLDSRGEEDNAPPRSHDFEWTPATREHQVRGKHPHLNILNEVFVETVGGDLTIKVENNTETGEGVYREPVEDANQTLDDAEVAYAKLGGLILLRIKPFREPRHRYLVFNTRSAHVLRADAIGQACVALPEDHGIVFPGGYYLQSGEHKVFGQAAADELLERVIKSPNGEDVLFVFHRGEDGEYALLPYNLIRKEIANPIRCHGYSLFPDGTMVLFRASPAEEATRVHPVQIWKTPFTTAEFAATAPTDGSYLAKVGNRDLVAGISEVFAIRRLVASPQPTRRTFEDLIATTSRLIDGHYWLGHPDCGDLLSSLVTLRKTCELIVDEYEKQRQIEKRARDALEGSERQTAELLGALRAETLTSVEAYLNALRELQAQRGRVLTLRELRAVDVARVDAQEAQLLERFQEVSRACVQFFLRADAFAPLIERMTTLIASIEGVGKSSELGPMREELDRIHEGLTLLSETVSSLEIEDPTARTAVLEGTGVAFAQHNRARAVFEGRRKALSVAEARAEFAAQFRLFGQTVTGALALCTTPDACDEQLGRVLLQLEALESRFGEFEEFAPELASKREEVTDAIESRRQMLVEERQRRAAHLVAAAERLLTSVTRRAEQFATPDELNAFFVADPVVRKLSDLQAQLARLGDATRAEELASKLKALRQTAQRTQRDRAELFEGGSNVVKLGAHRFSVSTQPLELSIVPRAGALAVHLTGTDFYQPIEDERLTELRDVWDQAIVSESEAVYRGEFLAVSLLLDAEERRSGLDLDGLHKAAIEGRLLEVVRAHAEPRVEESYERGVHDADAALILEKLLSAHQSAGLLRFSSTVRAVGWLWLLGLPEAERRLVHRRALSAGRLRAGLGHALALRKLASELAPRIAAQLPTWPVEVPAQAAATTARYVVEELARERARFTVSGAASDLRDELRRDLDGRGLWRSLEEDLRALAAHPTEQLGAALAYFDGFVANAGIADAAQFRLEVAALLVLDRALEAEVSHAATELRVEGLLGAHPRLEQRVLSTTLPEMLERVGAFIEQRVPRFRAFRQLRATIAEAERQRLRLSEFAPRVLTSFVRNRLIDQVYLPLIGNNLAKQIGSVGDKKRTDSSGLLLLISPPGYGKTTLMEYVANRLGLIFMKVNGPALGHEVTSVDPAQAPSATARQEVDKINLALEMGNNVMLYLDDVQHTSPELLQKFISLCDAQRKMEGVWNGQTRTYDLRGKRFCIVMAGNPYTESGARFQIPDMLANRADTYNLGDILSGREDLFAQSYLENCLTSNPVLAPLAGRDPADLQRLFRMAQGEEVAQSELSHAYSAAELTEVVELLRRLFKVQQVLLQVNLLYIASASMDDRFRTEPPFKLQGSYRNMNKLAEKVVSAMNDEELERLIDDHYRGEAQTLTTGAEHNLLKLAELRGRLTPDERARWEAIKESFARIKKMGGKEDDPVARVTGTLSGLDDQLKGIREALVRVSAREPQPPPWLDAKVTSIERALGDLARPRVEVRLSDPDGQGLSNVVLQQLELLRSVFAQWLQTSSEPPRAEARMDERIEELSALLQSVYQLVQRAGPAPQRVEAALAPHSPSNFWRPVSGHDVVQDGGLFVATYERPPALGAPVQLSIAFPGGARCELLGQVAWLQDELGDHSPAGYGVRLRQVPAPARQLIDAYVSAREPLLRDD